MATSPAPPSGSVTFLFTDVEGSTALWERHGEVMAAALEAHDLCLRTAATNHGGYVFTTAGDSFSVAFSTPLDAIAAAVEAQLALAEPLAGLTIRVRMGLHTGSAIVRDGDYFGPVLNRSARLMAVGHGGQILVSGALHEALAGSLPEDVELTDLGEHQLKDLSRPEHIYQVQHPDLEARFPPLRSIRATSTNLPVQLTSFVGRDVELREASRLLASTRLLTITGTGGSGKTRLAMQLGADLLDEFPGGVRLVELAPLAEPELVPDEVAKVLGVTLQPEQDAVTTIAEKLRDRKLLLIVDNSEYLVDAVADVAEALLHACPGLKILATSIELLRVPGEVAYRLPPMVLPAAEDDVETVRNSDAVRLLTERALAVRPAFAVTEENRDAVVAVVRRLDGIPLALELAAARLRSLSLQQIAARLDQQFRLLAGGRRTKVARHKTLEAAIDWSHQLLTPDEQVLFRRLSVFTGNFTLAAAEAVCCTEPLDPADVFDLIAELVDKSMVAAEEGPGGENRYRMLDTLRRYGSIKLHAAEEFEPTRIAHLDYYRQLAGELDELHLSEHSGRAVALLAEDQDNVRTALGFALGEGRLEDAAEIFQRLWFLWYHSGRSREAVEWGSDLFARGPELADDLLAAALHGQGTLLGIWGDTAAGIDMLQQEVDLRRDLDDPAALGSALNNLGNLLRDAGRVDEAQTVFREAIEVRSAAGLSSYMQLISLAEIALNADDHEKAIAQYAEALAEAGGAGDAYAVALATFNLGQTAVRRGDGVDGVPQLESARQSFLEQGVQPGVAEADFYLALAARADGRRGEAVHRLLASIDASDAHWTASLTFWILQVAATVIGDHEVGAELLGAAHSLQVRSAEPQPAFFVRDFAAAVDQLTGVLGEDRFADRFAAGQSLAATDAVALARYTLREEM